MANNTQAGAKPASQGSTAPKNDTKAEAPAEHVNLAKPNFVKKLTTKIIGFNKSTLQKMVIDDEDKKEKETYHLYSIIGICTGCKVGESDYGGWVGFTGQFEAVRFDNGAKFLSPVAFIPEPASSMINSALDQAARRGEDPNLRFAFIIGVKWSSAAIGYEYVVEPVLKASDNDALSELRALIAPRVPALAHQK